MQQIYTFISLLCACIAIMNPQTLKASQNDQEETKPVRILELLPNLLRPLAVEPSIPADFIALSPTGNLDPSDWIYWGPKNVLNAYFEDPTSLKEPIIRVKLCPDVTQSGPNSFDKNFMNLLKKLKQVNPKGFTRSEMKWGSYPVLALTLNDGERFYTSAWVGLNDPEAGWTLLFDLIYPDMKRPPEKKESQFWENFLKKTSLLQDGDYFKAYGQDLREGYTLVNMGGAKLKILAEKRQSDGMIQVVVIPENSDVEFQYVDMMEGSMGAKWKQGERLVKVYGEIVLNDKNNTSYIQSATSIFYKIVPDFSFKKEEGKKALIFQKNLRKGF